MYIKNVARILLIGALFTACLTACHLQSPEPSTIPKENDVVDQSRPLNDTGITSSTPGPTLPPWAADPKGYILDVLNQGFSNDNWAIRFWIFPGSGPVTVNMNATEYGQAIQDLFSALDWELTDRDHYDEVDSTSAGLPGAYGVDFYYPEWRKPIVHISCHSYSDMIRLEISSINGNENAYECCYFQADGAASLCNDLASLWPGPEVSFGLIRIPKKETDEATAEEYMTALFDRLTNDGHITDAELRTVTILPQNPAEGSDGYNFNILMFQTTFMLCPALPQLTYWQDKNASENGWVKYEDFFVCLQYNSENNSYGLSYYNT